MNSVFIVNGTMMCIRDLNKMDIQNHYYDVMSLLSNNIRMLLIKGADYTNFENKYKISIIEDMHSQIILGTGIAYIENSTTAISKIGKIEHIGIHRSFINSELKTKMIDYLKNYCLVDEKCIKLDIQV